MPKRLIDEGLSRGLNYNGEGGSNPSFSSVPSPSSPNADLPTDVSRPRTFVQPGGVDSAPNGRPARGPQPSATNTGVLQPAVPGVASSPAGFDPLSFGETAPSIPSPSAPQLPSTPQPPATTTTSAATTTPAVAPSASPETGAAEQPTAPAPPPVYRGEKSALPEGGVMQTPAGTVSRRGGEDRMQLSPLGRKAYRAAHAKSVAAFGDYPGRGDMSQPQPTVIPGQPNFNPFTGQWTE